MSRDLSLHVHLPTSSKPLELVVASSSRVADIKKLISLKMAEKPDVEEQRIVYAGCILNDDQLCLEQVLRRDERQEFCDKYVFHLALTATFFNKNSQMMENENNKTAKSVQMASQETPAPSNINHDNATGHPMSNMNNNDSQGSHSSHVEQAHHWYHWYYMYYMHHHHQQQHHHQQHQHHQHHFYNHVESPVVPAPAQLMAPANMGLNNAAEVVEEEMANQEENFNELEENNGQPRDLLDWFYVSSRLIVLVSVVYFYSSLARFAMVATMAMFVVLWNARQVRLRQRQHQQQQQQQQQPQQQQQQQQQQPEQQQPPPQAGHDQREPQGAPGNERQVEEEQETEGGRREDVVESLVAVNATTNDSNSSLSVAATFFTTLFMSLLPDHPQIV